MLGPSDTEIGKIFLLELAAQDFPTTIPSPINFTLVWPSY